MAVSEKQSLATTYIVKVSLIKQTFSQFIIKCLLQGSVADEIVQEHTLVDKMLTAPGIPRRSPIQVLTRPDPA